MNDEFKMTAPQESLIHAYMEMETVDENTVNSLYTIMNNAIQSYLDQLASSVPVSILYSCHYVEVSFVFESEYR